MIINLIAKLFFTISIFFFVLNPEDFEFVPILNGLGFVFSGFLGFVYSLKYVNLVMPRCNEVIQISRESLYLLASNFAVNLYTSSNTLILGFFCWRFHCGGIRKYGEISGSYKEYLYSFVPSDISLFIK